MNISFMLMRLVYIFMRVQKIYLGLSLPVLIYEHNGFQPFAAGCKNTVNPVRRLRFHRSAIFIKRLWSADNNLDVIPKFSYRYEIIRLVRRFELMKKLLSLLVAVMCANLFALDFSSVKEGDAKRSIVRTLGRPFKTVTSADTKQDAHYQYMGHTLTNIRDI